jgi:acetyltransferase-like isoleucine patch superfamily enzyme
MSSPYIYSIKNISVEGGLLEVGKNVSIECFASVICFKHIKIGDNTMVGPGAVIIDTDHYIGPDYEKTTDYGEMADVIIGKNCWIGANACVLKGVHLGDGCVVGAGAVVTKSFPSGAIIGGNPAHLIRMRYEDSLYRS